MYTKLIILITVLGICGINAVPQKNKYKKHKSRFEVDSSIEDETGFEVVKVKMPSCGARVDGYIVPFSNESHFAKIDCLLVNKKHRHKGYGKRILSRMLTELYKQGASKVALSAEPFEDNTPANLDRLIHWYQSQGGRCVFKGEEQAYIEFTKDNQDV